jgi:hypothetical protein
VLLSDFFGAAALAQPRFQPAKLGRQRAKPRSLLGGSRGCFRTHPRLRDRNSSRLRLKMKAAALKIPLGLNWLEHSTARGAKTNYTPHASPRTKLKARNRAHCFVRLRAFGCAASRRKSLVYSSQTVA